MEKKNYRIRMYTRKGKEIKSKVSTEFYGLTEQQAIWMSIGISIGLKQKYSNPKTLLYEVDGCAERLVRCQQ